MFRRARAAVFAASLAALLPACAPQRAIAPEPATAAAPAGFPRAYYEEAAARGEAVYRLDPAQSLVTIEVKRGGSLARLGHDHVVAARNVTGYVAPAAGRADLYVALDGLTVDEAVLREAAGLDTRPSESDIAGTRANMLERVLETGKFPYALLHVERAGTGGNLAVALTLHGVTRKLDVPAQITVDDGQADATGRLALAQTDFGITPFSILGGAIRVEDRLDLKFSVRSRREPSARARP